MSIINGKFDIVIILIWNNILYIRGYPIDVNIIWKGIVIAFICNVLICSLIVGWVRWGRRIISFIITDNATTNILLFQELHSLKDIIGYNIDKYGSNSTIPLSHFFIVKLINLTFKIKKKFDDVGFSQDMPK